MRRIPYLITFPRSGSHYFDELIYKELGIHIEKSHSVNELFDQENQQKRKIITIVRDPIDTILSVRASELRGEQESEFSQDGRTHQTLSNYILLNNFLYEHADYVIDFNDLIFYPDKTIKKIISILNIDEEDYRKFDREDYPYAAEYLPSSKKLSSYDKKILDGFDMSLCYFYYNKILDKKIII